MLKLIYYKNGQYQNDYLTDYVFPSDCPVMMIGFDSNSNPVTLANKQAIESRYRLISHSQAQIQDQGQNLQNQALQDDNRRLQQQIEALQGQLQYLQQSSPDNQSEQYIQLQRQFSTIQRRFSQLQQENQRLRAQGSSSSSISNYFSDINSQKIIQLGIGIFLIYLILKK